MSENWLVDVIRSRVFLVALPGMTVRRERQMIKSLHGLATSARARGVPLTAAWDLVGGFIECAVARMPTEQERETFVAIMQRARAEVFHGRAFVAN